MRVGLVDGCRTPFTRAGGALSSASALDLAIHAVREASLSAGLAAGEVDTLVLGAATPDSTIPYLARETATARSGAFTVADCLRSAASGGTFGSAGAVIALTAAHAGLIGGDVLPHADDRTRP